MMNKKIYGLLGVMMFVSTWGLYGMEPSIGTNDKKDPGAALIILQPTNEDIESFIQKITTNYNTDFDKKTIAIPNNNDAVGIQSTTPQMRIIKIPPNLAKKFEDIINTKTVKKPNFSNSLWNNIDKEIESRLSNLRKPNKSFCKKLLELFGYLVFIGAIPSGVISLGAGVAFILESVREKKDDLMWIGIMFLINGCISFFCVCLGAGRPLYSVLTNTCKDYQKARILYSNRPL